MNRDLREELRKIIPETKISLVPRSYDIIGSRQKAIAVLEIPDEINHFEAKIAKALMKINKSVKSVLLKESARLGEHRTRVLRLVAGDPDTEVLHKEAGCFFRLNPMTVYFSPREITERDRISAAVRGSEEILVMFCGIGPLPIRIVKCNKNVRITAAEINSEAYNYCVENIHLNRVADRIEVIQGDVREVCTKLGKKYDRVIMPLPKGAYKFLDVAMSVLEDNGVLHFYYWAPEKDPFSEAEKLIFKAAEEEGRKAEIIKRVKVSQYSPRIWKVRINARILRS
jgi:tRNA (guanine37-N1)-methyltransferase